MDIENLHWIRYGDFVIVTPMTKKELEAFIKKFLDDNHGVFKKAMFQTWMSDRGHKIDFSTYDYW